MAAKKKKTLLQGAPTHHLPLRIPTKVTQSCCNVIACHVLCGQVSGRGPAQVLARGGLSLHTSGVISPCPTHRPTRIAPFYGLGQDAAAPPRAKQTPLLKIASPALRAGRSTKLSWHYDGRDELTGAFCDGVWFPRDELMALSTL